MNLDQLLPHVKSVAIEMSNLCDMAGQHPECPLFFQGQAVILDTRIISDVLKTLSDWGYTGSVSFHRYNESFIDPRLYWFLNDPSTDLRVKLCTNGNFLTRSILRDLDSLGVEHLHVSAYTEECRNRIQRTYDAMPEMEMSLEALHHKKFVKLLDIYDRDEWPMDKPCAAPLGEIVINCHGQVTLCCRDWQNRYTFGDLHSLPLSVIITSQTFVDTWERLMRGERFLDICKRCATSRGIG